MCIGSPHIQPMKHKLMNGDPSPPKKTKQNNINHKTIIHIFHLFFTILFLKKREIRHWLKHVLTFVFIA